MQERGVLRMHVLLDVPYQEKDLAKKEGLDGIHSSNHGM